VNIIGHLGGMFSSQSLALVLTIKPEQRELKHEERIQNSSSRSIILTSLPNRWVLRQYLS